MLRLWMFLGASWIAGCTVTLPSPPSECSASNVEGLCSEGRQCLDGTCVAQEAMCSSQNPVGLCSPDQGCVDGACTILTAAQRCSSANPNGPCAGGGYCLDGRCYRADKTGCSPTLTAGLCPAGQRCAQGQCVAEDTPGCATAVPHGRCENLKDCSGGVCTIPDFGTCSPAVPDGVCPVDNVCVQGVCVALDPGANRCSAAFPQGLCPQGETCRAGTCEAIAPDQACSATNPGGLCPAPGQCNAGQCAVPACSADAPSGACPPGAVCSAGTCIPVPCSTLHPAGACPSGQACGDGTCECECAEPCGTAQVCDLDLASPTCGSCVCDTTCGNGCGDGQTCDADLASPTCGNCKCDTACGRGCGNGQTCDTDLTSPTCGSCGCDTSCGGGCGNGQICNANPASPTCGNCVCDTSCGGGCGNGQICNTNLASPACGTCGCDTSCGGGCGNGQICDVDLASPTCGTCGCDTSCGGIRCSFGETCDPRTSSATCGTCTCLSGASCPINGRCCQGSQQCVFSRYCREPCPGNKYCGAQGELCCGVGQTCGPELTCIAECAAGQEVCGPSQSICCGVGQACIYDACLDLGASCTNFLDCDFGEFCEPTLGRCLPEDIGGGATCAFPPPPDIFKPNVEWHFLGVRNNGGVWELCSGPDVNTDNGCYKNVETAPFVADLDQQVATTDLIYNNPWTGLNTTYPAGNKYPEVVFKAYRTANFNDHVIVVLDGRDGSLKRVLPNHRRGHVAVGNLDADDPLEIVAADGDRVIGVDPFYAPPPSGGTLCPILDTRGACEVRWSNATSALANPSNTAAPTLTDLNGDGQTEMVFGSFVLDPRDGLLLLAPTTVCAGASADLAALFGADSGVEGPIVAVADVDLDGVPELVVGDKAIEVTHRGTDPRAGWECRLDWESNAEVNAGTIVRNRQRVAPRGYVAVANFVDNTAAPYVNDSDTVNYPSDQDYPEVAITNNGVVAILHGKTGKVMKSPVDGTTPLRFNLFTKRGGAPNVADLDGDTRLEFSFAGAGCMVVVDPDCAVADAATRKGLATTPNSGCAVDPDAVVEKCNEAVRPGIGDMLGLLWMDRTQDASSAATGTSVFDFQGDGVAEVLYNDECFFRVYDGTSGQVLLERPNSHRTATEYPIVVDVDGDGSSEILFASTNDKALDRDRCGGARNAYQSGFDKNGNALELYSTAFCTCGHLTEESRCNPRPGCRWDTASGRCETDPTSTRPDDPADICEVGTWGVWALGDTSERWVKTLPYWHQHTYHVTDISRFGQPLADWGSGNNNWDQYNNYRQNVQGAVPLNAPNLNAANLVADLSQCPPEVKLRARVSNLGSRGFDPAIDGSLPISFYKLVDPPNNVTEPVFLGTQTVSRTIPPGSGIFVEFTYQLDGQETPSFVAVVNDNGSAQNLVAECRADDNITDPTPPAVCSDR